MSKSEPIFVIDDDESVRVSLSRLLRSAGFTCKAYPSAEDFVADLHANTGGCAIVDIHMPGMNGIELMNLLLSTKPGIRIVLITAFDDPDARKAALAVGVETLRKPFDDSALLSAVGKLSTPA